MAQEVWVIAGVVVLVALQFVVYRFLRRWTDTTSTNGRRPNDERLPSHTIPGDQQPESVSNPNEDTTVEDGIQCSTCGAINGTDFTFCRRCANRLAA